jgi:hypothetical protein
VHQLSFQMLSMKQYLWGLCVCVCVCVCACMCAEYIFAGGEEELIGILVEE